MYWEDGADRRVLFTAGDRLFSVDARTGRPDPKFRDGGFANLHEGLGEGIDELFVSSNTPGAVYMDLVILGTRVSEQSDAAPGYIRAWNIRTGDLAWVFHTVPHPGELGHDTWPEDAWESVGGANSWAGMSIDPDRGVVYIPTGSPAFDFYGGNRHGKNLFGNSILALNAETGEYIWHFQIVHHDIWDRDPPAPPNLLTVTHDGKRIDALAQITKSGHVFLLNRDTGEPLFPVVETPVAPSTLPGEEAWPTQPLPIKPPPFARQYLSRNELNYLSPEYEDIIKRFMQLRSGGQFTPPSREGTVIFPGFDGGGEWGGAAHDPGGILYVNSNEMPWVLTMFELESTGRVTERIGGAELYAMNCASCHGIDRRGDVTGVYPSLIDVHERLSRDDVRQLLMTGRGFMPSFARMTNTERDQIAAFLFGDEGPLMPDVPEERTDQRKIPTVRFAHTGYHRFVDSLGYPAVKPPWGTMNAIDLNEGEILWQVPLGELPELTARGIPRTGLENYGGPVVTAGGVIFIGATKDEMFRALDSRTGAVLFETKLPAGGYATPATYEVDGRQYVVIAAGGGKMGTKSGDAYVAFALPE
jgi:quinoprotein glucose dehydrogenase